MVTSVPIAFLAGLLSVLTPCVLPLVPGYLSAISAVESGRLGAAGSARRVVRASTPFFLGFTVVFVLLGVGAALLADAIGDAQAQIAGFVLIVFGLAFMGLLPLPTAVVAPGLLARARSRGSNALLGAAFALCAAPCIGPVLAGVLVLAGGAGTVLQGAALLLAYSSGIAFAFLLAGIAFARAMAAFRWVRDRFDLIQTASGALLVALGGLLFFDRFWWLRVYLNRALNTVGLGV
ncbi:MAG: cytochrome c biogenesis CcdA family protein [Gaiellaceae bacterium]